METFVIILIIISAYIIGSIPFSLLVGKFIAGVDIRQRGSGNIGATNVLRTLGTGGAILALLGDLLKGLVATWLGMLVGGPGLAAICAILVIIGHCYSVFLAFKGGKGVATSAGIMLYLMPKVVVILLVTFVIVVALSKYVSLGSITVATLFPVMAVLLSYSNVYIIMSFVMAIIVVFQHRENIVRLRNGKENRIGQKV
ncbi:MAG TPA: glycerol-3-phosphate 1-O-acyltransferase PlsY [Syntrophomonadaceae bacterium]|nr:glycerol-3-phosphate 1-O-acyltransferase PlsY [Syntrophomonadaceae bacterium]